MISSVARCRGRDRRCRRPRPRRHRARRRRGLRRVGRAAAAPELVAAVTSLYPVGAAARPHEVVAGGRSDHVVAGLAADEVVAAEAEDRVVAAEGDEHVRARGPGELVVAGGADDRRRSPRALGRRRRLDDGRRLGVGVVRGDRVRIGRRHARRVHQLARLLRLNPQRHRRLPGARERAERADDLLALAVARPLGRAGGDEIEVVRELVGRARPRWRRPGRRW